jgi:hypothetical protein
VNKKITKKMMDKRPKKKRPSDKNRNNINADKCITKVVGAPAEFSIVSADDYAKVRVEALAFWDNGDSEAEWLEITAEDMDLKLSPSIEPLPVGGVQKKPALAKSGSC